MKSTIGHSIKHRQKPNDDFYTPPELARECVRLVKPIGSILDPCRGNGAFFNNLPRGTKYCELKEGKDFYKFNEKIDWIISNPPYSDLDKWLKHSFKLARKGVAYLLGINNLTARRLELANHYGFGLTKMSMFKVFKWWGMSLFVVWEKGKKDIIKYNRKVWR